MIDLKRNLFKIDVRAQKDEEKVFMRTAWSTNKMKFTIITNYDTLSRKSFTIEGDNMTIFRKKEIFQ